MSPFETIYRASNSKWGYESILKMLNQQCINVAHELNGHVNRLENERIDAAKAIAKGEKPRPQIACSRSGLEQKLACLLVNVEQALVLLQDKYPDSKRDIDSYLKHWRYVTEMNSEEENK